MKNVLKQIQWVLGGKHKTSYSQCGEDIIISKALKELDIEKPYYIDIGANDPIILNNTYFFYKRGGSGICVEPNPSLAKSIRKKRPRDICIEAGVGSRGVLKYRMFDSHELNTFSDTEADEAVRKGHKLLESRDIEMIPFQEILRQAQKPIDLMSIDVEGMDFEILKDIDLKAAQPKIICIETKSFKDESSTSIVDYLERNGYTLISKTLLNGIFADTNLWQTRKRS